MDWGVIGLLFTSMAVMGLIVQNIDQSRRIKLLEYRAKALEDVLVTLEGRNNGSS